MAQQLASKDADCISAHDQGDLKPGQCIWTTLQRIHDHEQTAERAIGAVRTLLGPEKISLAASFDSFMRAISPAGLELTSPHSWRWT